MITVNCRDIKSIKNELLVYVSDQIGAIPTLKTHDFTLSPIDDEEIKSKEVIAVIKEFLESIGEGRNFAVIGRDDVILVKSISGKTIERDSLPESMFSCPHCGFLTQYEEEYHNHVKIHYL